MLTQTLRTAAIAAVSITCLAAAADAARPNHYDDHHYASPLPRFGMHSYNSGHGEVIVSVRRGGLACQLGLERGDVVKELNDYRLRYHGSWEDALSQAMAQGGHVELCIRDARSGRLVHRHIDFDPYGHVIGRPVGPITPKAVEVGRPIYERRPIIEHHIAPPRCDTPKHRPAPPAPPIITPKAAPKTVNYRRAVEQVMSHHNVQPRINLRFKM